MRHKSELDLDSINKQCFDMWLEDKQMLDLLDDMDIPTANRASLFHVLDSDMSGSLQMKEVVDGLMKLRGPAERDGVRPPEALSSRGPRPGGARGPAVGAVLEW